MALKPEVKAWLDSLPLGKEAKEVLEKEAEREEVQVKLRETVLARSDYSRSMDALRTQEQALKAEADTAKQRAESLIQANVKWRNDNQGVLAKAVEDAKKKEAILAQAQQRIQSLVDQGLPIDPRDILGDPSDHRGEPPQPLAPGKRVFNEDQMAELMKRKEMEFAFAMANFEDLADQHRRLFNESLNRKELVKEMLEKGKTLEDVWREKYKVDDKEKELAEAEITERVQKAVAEERTKILSERYAPGSPVAGIGLGDEHIINVLKPTGTGGRSDAVQAAMDSWQKGEFREPPPSPKTP